MRKAALFDLDDTIFDHQHSRRSALAALIAGYPAVSGTTVVQLESIHERHLQATHALILAGQLTPAEGRRERMRLLFADLGLALTADELGRADATYRTAYDAARRAVPGVVAVIRALRETMKLAVVTNGLVTEQEEKLRLCGLADQFDATVISEQVRMKKPSREVFTHTLSALGVKADEAVFVGDSWKLDVMGATNAGIPAIWFNRYGASCPDPGLAVEVVSLESAEDIIRLLKG